ncbi:LodA/GoxA family CTQ-dependent oxidase [Actinomadura rugatobispora]|uniref:LodA/GoxA family CTQ-dependent oxidase n=1 Tax=Actinomadura rugatobispora TaxID=1994 RepID=A0ABW1A8A5_9ACTN
MSSVSTNILADITTVRIHPAIGIARLGNSDTDFFVGPEIPGKPPNPPGATLEEKFKDASRRVKRQAARFRCYGYTEQGEWVDLTGRPDVKINWKVTLVNRKAAAPNFMDSGRRNEGQSPQDLIIAPTPRTVTGTNQRAALDDGRVRFTVDGQPHEFPGIYLGEIRTDDKGCLMVLGGRGLSQCHPKVAGQGLGAFNNDCWYDDTSDGPVEATVTLTIDGGSRQLAAERAWVIAAPAKFAPEMDSPTTLWDQLQYTLGTGTAPARPSYNKDIYPILQRARTIKGVYPLPVSDHAWQDEVKDPDIRKGIFDRLRKWSATGQSGGNMPLLAGLQPSYPSLTPLQYQVMQRWREGNYDSDWNGHPPDPGNTITPAGLDRAALDACVGAAFFPGIEGGQFLIDKNTQGVPKNWKKPYERLRFADTVMAGDVTAQMAIPWQADFNACGQGWWPVPRPNSVFPKGQTTRATWTRGLQGPEDMVKRWNQLGVVVRDSTGNYVEVARTLAMPSPHELVEHPFSVQPVVAGPQSLWSHPGELAADAADSNLISFGQATATAGETQRWPLWLTEADSTLTVEVRSTDLDSLAISVECPFGPRLKSGDAGVVTSRPDGQRTVLRIGLPLTVPPGRYVREGHWQVHVASQRQDGPVTYQLAATVDSLIMFPSLTTTAADGSLNTSVDFSGTPISQGVASLWPMSTQEEYPEVTLQAAGAPQLERATGQVAVAPQTQYLRVQATGLSPMGHPFVRERLLRMDELR